MFYFLFDLIPLTASAVGAFVCWAFHSWFFWEGLGEGWAAHRCKRCGRQWDTLNY